MSMDQKTELVRASFHQERIWFIDKFERNTLYPKGPTYHNIPIILSHKGQLDSELVTEALRRIISKHEVLRTSANYVEDILYQSISSDSTPQLTVLQDSGMQSEEETIQWMLQLTRQAFEDGLDRPLFRSFLLNQGDTAYLTLVLHHFICDDISAGIIKKEFILEYGNLCAGCPYDAQELPLQYADFSTWQRELDNEIIETDLLYWKGKLGDKLQGLELPYDSRRKNVHIYDGKMIFANISPALAGKVENCAALLGTGKKQIYMAAFKVLLMKYSRQSEINIGTSISERIDDNLNDTMGPFSNLMTLHDLIEKTSSFSRIVSDVEQTYDEAVAHATIPFDLLVAKLKPDNDMSRTALFDVFFNYVKYNSVSQGDFREIPLNYGYGKYDYNVLVRESGEDISVLMTYNQLYYAKDTSQRLLDSYTVLLDSLVSDPFSPVDQAAYISRKDEDKMLNDWCTIRKSTNPGVCIDRVLDETADKFPDRTAVVFENQHITYAQLRDKSWQLANYLKQRGIGPGHICALIMDKSISCIITMLAIIKTGGCYLPIAPDLPDQRRNYILDDSDATLVIADEAYIGLCGSRPYVSYEAAIEEWASLYAERDYVSHCDTPLYIIYTSGTTGNPKGMVIAHKNLCGLLECIDEYYEVDENDVWSMFHSYNFDFSVWEMYGALTTGGKLVIVSKVASKDTHSFRKLLKNEGVTVLSQTPSAFYALSAEESRFENHDLDIRYIVFGGEALAFSALGQWRSMYGGVRLINMYGITETTIHVTFKQISDEEIHAGRDSIGKALANYKVLIVDEHQRLLPIGVPGEIAVGGIGVGSHYLNKPDLTAKVFLDDPYEKGGRLYLSGDLAMYDNGGELHYVGRRDSQVKIRGFRIETKEIENVLLKHEGIHLAHVIAERVGGEFQLAAYLKIAENMDLRTIRNFIKNLLPDYMIPQKFYAIDSIPMTTNGKADINKLKETSRQIKDSVVQVYPLTPIQKDLSAIWSDILGCGEVGINENFFTLGGNSLMVTKLIYRIAQIYRVEIPYEYFFSNPTIEDSEAYISGKEVCSGVTMEDIAADSQPDDELTAAAQKYDRKIPTGRGVLITGATGFLGAFLLHSILCADREAMVYCLVRAKDDQQASERIEKTLKAYGIFDRNHFCRICAIASDLSVPYFGHTPERYEALAEHVSKIYHLAANTSQGYSYSYLKGTNVGGTKEVIRFALTGCRKIIHYVSTISIFDCTTADRITEDTVPQVQDGNALGGYALTKLVSERMLCNAAAQFGVDYDIFRVGRIGGASVTGACQANDFIWLIIGAAAELKMFPDIPIQPDMIPVDILAKVISSITKDGLRKNGACYHILCEQSINSEMLTQWLTALIPGLTRVPFEVWIDQLRKFALASENSICARLFPILAGASGNEYGSGTDLASRIDQSNTIEAVGTGFLEESKYSKDMFGRIFSYLSEAGVLNVETGS